MTDTAKRGRPSTIATGKQIAAVLKTIGTESSPSRYITQQLAEQGYVEFIAQRTGARGRPRQEPVLTPQGTRLLNLARNW